MSEHFRYSPSVILFPFILVFILWISFWADTKFDLDLAELGVYPRDLIGLRGVVLSPFVHGSIGHLYNNSIPLLVLTSAMTYFYRNVALKVVIWGIVLSGVLTWLIGRENYHIGASGLIYVLVSFIFFKGIMTRYYRLVAVSLLAVFLYGGMIWYVFPDIEKGISWEGHLAGLITGFVFSIYFKTPEYVKPIRYEWERADYDPSNDKFMQRFDEHGNFVNPPKPEPEDIIQPPPQIVYTFIPNEPANPGPSDSYRDSGYPFVQRGAAIDNSEEQENAPDKKGLEG